MHLHTHITTVVASFFAFPISSYLPHHPCASSRSLRERTYTENTLADKLPQRTQHFMEDFKICWIVEYLLKDIEEIEEDQDICKQQL